MIDCLLFSRMETGLVSDHGFNDKDVNVYPAHLLHSFLDPEYVEQSKKYLSKYDTDVLRRLQTSTDGRLKAGQGGLRRPRQDLLPLRLLVLAADPPPQRGDL